MGKEDVRLVVNRVDARLYRSLHLTVDDVMDWVGYPLLGLVPEDRNVMLAAVHDRPVLLYARRCAAAKAFRRMAKRLQGLPVPWPACNFRTVWIRSLRAWSDRMNIAFLAHDKRKELMVQFCTAYKSILSKHTLYATATTGRLVAEATGLPITLLLSHKQGGHQQVNARIAYNEIDLVLLFTNPDAIDPWDGQQMLETIRFCDKHNVPVATNLASAEMLILGLQRGDLDWREMTRSKNTLRI